MITLFLIISFDDFIATDDTIVTDDIAVTDDIIVTDDIKTYTLLLIRMSATDHY
jgi:hypothetical protein